MKSFTVRLFAVTVALSIGAALSGSITLGQTPPQTPVPEKRSTSRWQWNDDGWKRRVEISGKAEFTEDYSDVSSLSEGGSLTLEEDHNGQSQRLEVRRDQNGGRSAGIL